MITKLKEVASIQLGYQARTTIKSSSDGAFSIIQGKDFDSPNELRMDNLIRFNPELNPERYSVRKGDVLFLSKGTKHFSYCIEKELNNTLVSGAFYVIRVMDGHLLPSYLSWYLNQKPAQVYFESQSGKTVLSFVSIRSLSQLSIQIPSFSIQQSISQIHYLWRKEQLLKSKLEKNRSDLISAISLKAIQDKGE
jgi:restriction endonuclease S subunit